MTIDPTAFIHEEAIVIGDVTLGPEVSVWPTAVIRADSAPVTIGGASNVQDGTVIHADPGFPAIIGSRVAIGHRAIVHGATIEDECLIGMGAIVLNGARIGRGSLLGAGTVIPEGVIIPPNSVVLGVPGKVVREMTAELKARITKTVEAYLALQRAHRSGTYKRHR